MRVGVPRPGPALRPLTVPWAGGQHQPHPCGAGPGPGAGPAGSCESVGPLRFPGGQAWRGLTSGLASELRPDGDIGLEHGLQLHHQLQPEGGGHLQVGGRLLEDSDVACRGDRGSAGDARPGPGGTGSGCDLPVLYGSHLVSPLLVTTSSWEITILSWREGSESLGAGGWGLGPSGTVCSGWAGAVVTNGAAEGGLPGWTRR